MATTYRQLIYAAVTNATRGQPPSLSPAVDAEGIAETLFSIAAQAVSEAAAADPYKRSLLRREKSITLTAGTATLVDDVLTKYFPDATLIDATTLARRYAYRDYPDFVRRNDPRLGYFTRNGTTLMVRDPNQSFTQPLTATGARTLVVPCVILRPVTADANVDAPDEILSDLIETLSESLRGELIKRAGENA
jgi:hypothetical protein